MKKWKIILASILALLVLTAVPLSVMAEGQTTPTNTPVQTPQVHLAIVQPLVVRVGEQMQLTVFERLHQTPISGASIFSVTRDKLKALKQAIQDLKAKRTSSITESDYETILNNQGVLLGQTDADGRLTHTFNDPGNYLLVAVGQGYLPGISALSVREALSITSPRSAPPGDKVTITVDQKGTTEPVSGAKVWAIDFTTAKTLKNKLAALKAADKGNLLNKNWGSILDGLATPLGTTDSSGQVTHSFGKGRYLLLATKEGCTPAFIGIAIVPPRANASPSVQPETSSTPAGLVD